MIVADANNSNATPIVGSAAGKADQQTMIMRRLAYCFKSIVERSRDAADAPMRE